jgi:hypothetical protein
MVPWLAFGILRCNDVATQKNVVKTHEARRPYVPRVFTEGSGAQAETFPKGLNRGVRIGDGASFPWGTAGMFLAGDLVRKKLLMMLSDETK